MIRLLKIAARDYVAYVRTPGFWLSILLLPVGITVFGAAPILMALAQLGVPAGRSVWYLGDTALDMVAARAAGVKEIAVVVDDRIVGADVDVRRVRRAEMTPHLVADDLEQWQPVFKWLDEPTTRYRPGSSREQKGSNSPQGLEHQAGGAA